MIITSFDYQENNWSLTDLSLGGLNLIVGKNAVGKSKTLNSLVRVAKIIRGDLNGLIWGHRCRIVFKLAEGDEMVFSYSINSQKQIEHEFLKKGDEVILERNKGVTLLRGEEANPPSDKLCVQSQRDTSNYPEFEAIINWAEQMNGFSFGDLSSFFSFAIPGMFNEQIEFSALYEHIKEEKREFVVAKMRELDYDVEKIEPVNISEKYTIITLIENGVSIPLHSYIMSNGMLRVFCIFSFLAYLSSEEGAKTLLIDDLGEGLDFGRSKKLSKIVFDYCEKQGIQLIVTSNDNFLMNAVELNKWIILQREKEKVIAISEKTHPELFLRFKRTGLNNFDIFGTDFVSKYLKSQEG